MLKNIIITEEVPGFFINELEKLGFEVNYFPHISKYEIELKISNYFAILIRSRFKIDKTLIEKAINLKLILRPGSGLEIIDTDAALKNNITIINSPEGNRDAVAEHALGSLLSLLNNITKSFDEIKAFNWKRNDNTGVELQGKTIGIIGYGNTGSAFAKLLSSFDVNIIAYDKYKTGFSNKYVKEVSEKVIHNTVDILSFHIPLNSETYDLFNKGYINKLKNPIYLINTSRGGIVNLKDLLWGIKEELILGAVLDVLENEDLTSYSKVEKDLFRKTINTNKVIITPHVAGKTIESEHRIFSILIKKIKILFPDFKKS